MVAVWLRRVLRARSRKSTALIALIIGAVGIFAAAAAQKADISKLTPQAIKITAIPFTFDNADSKRRVFGRLEWRGGLALLVLSPFFGGYSGLSLTADGGEMLAISDSGSWLSAKIISKDGQLVGVKDARIGPITQRDGRPLQRSSDRDAESLAALQQGKSLDGHYLIGFEGHHRIEDYVFRKGVLQGPVGRRPLPPQLKGMPRNQGLEGITLLRGGPYAGALVAFAERKLTKQGNHTGALVIAGKPNPLFLKRTGEFDVTDLESLKDGSLLVLERSFIPATLKLDSRLRLIPAQEIKPGALLQGEVLFSADQRYRIDNFEGMAVTEEGGETLITLISDDNFNFFQSTLLARFALKPR